MAVLKGKVNGQWQEIGAAYYQKFYPDEWLFKDGALNLNAYGNLVPADKYKVSDTSKMLNVLAQSSVYFESPITKSFAKIKIVVGNQSRFPKLRLGSTPTGGEYYDYAAKYSEAVLFLPAEPACGRSIFDRKYYQHHA